MKKEINRDNMKKRRSAFSFLAKLIEPKARDEDTRRREFILNIILFSTIVLAVIFNLFLLYRVIVTYPNHRGMSSAYLAGILIAFVLLLFLSKRGYSVLVSYILITIYLVIALYTSFHWGVDVPQALLVYALIIVIAGILLGTQFAIGLTLFIGISLLLITYLQTTGKITLNLYWREESITFSSVIEHIISLGLISIVTWLYNREINRSLIRARKSEADLKIERDSLEVKVKKRTKDLQEEQIKRIKQLHRFADFGQRASGIFHDLMNPLTALSINLERVCKSTDYQKEEEVGKLAVDLENILSTAHKMKDLLLAARKQVQEQNTKTRFPLKNEIKQVLSIFSYRGKKENVEIEFKAKEEIIAFGNPVKFSQMISNLIANALDAYEDCPGKKEKKIKVKLRSKGKEVLLTVEDWAAGIALENVNRIFKPLFTTKREKGSGIGLTTCKGIIEKDFHGKIQVKSKLNQGTIFTITFPKEID